MSFILEALKKSEADRQRQSGPALFEVKVAPPRRGLPLWAAAIAVLLGVNLVIGVWMLLRHPAQSPAAPGAMAAASAPAPAASPGLAAPVPTSPAPTAAGVVPAPAVAVGGPVLPVAASQTTGVMQPDTAPPASATPGPVLNPDDYEPASEPAAAPVFRVKRGTDGGLPLYQEAAAVPGAGLPQLRLDLHVFAASPRERFVMINMHKLREGDSLPEGVRLESITPDGAVLSHNGSQFLLPRE